MEIREQLVERLYAEVCRWFHEHNFEGTPRKLFAEAYDAGVTSRAPHHVNGVCSPPRGGQKGDVFVCPECGKRWENREFDEWKVTAPTATQGPVNWQKFRVERDGLPEHERENFTADVIDQIDDAEFARVLERNRAIYAEQYPEAAKTE